MRNEMEISFTSLPENEAFARMVISAFLIEKNPTLSVISEIRTAVSEAVTNSIVHAYKEMPDERIILRAVLDDRSVVIEVEDSGCGIENVELAMQPFYTSAPNQERTGMGFSLMLSFMDTVHVRSTPGEGTCVTMTKLLIDDDAR